MNELSGISSPHRLVSQARVSLVESTQKQVAVEAPVEMKEIAKFEIEMEHVNHAFTLVREIRTALESALRDVS